ncbi:GNAT family N-acetyltransferase [Chitinophaga qingshengii]|uniref:GNAT family N-acetyltransferase n=1 Tax=Chitinophaga qingshengii TaxID=1569794 RepID=A0ABR7TT20_9BACT|nr:GNAT family N-acetyltransferase [Chitinophaga qingshengii]MBC9933622.1 GNAT family N-acetyltransferase [Chitinophaga qingshengii]
MDTLVYEMATAADAAAIRDLSLLSYREFAAALEPEHRHAMQQHQTDMHKLEALMEQAGTFVCRSGERLVGVVFLVPSGQATTIYPADWSYIRQLGVDPAFRRMGIGRRLMELAIEEARRSGEKVLGLHTSTIMPAARKMYDELGFSLIRELPPILGQQYWLYKMSL